MKSVTKLSITFLLWSASGYETKKGRVTIRLVFWVRSGGVIKRRASLQEDW